MALALLIIALWILILSTVVCLCLSARQGDLLQREVTQRRETAPACPTDDPIEPSVISLRITAQPGRRVYPCDPAGLTGSATG
jgi:hypothetical protein